MLSMGGSTDIRKYTLFGSFLILGKYAQFGLRFPCPYPENPVKSSVLEMKIKCLIIASFAKIRQEYTSLNARQRP